MEKVNALLKRGNSIENIKTAPDTNIVKAITTTTNNNHQSFSIYFDASISSDAKALNPMHQLKTCHI